MAANGHVSATARQAGRLDARGCHQQPAPRRAVSPVHATTSERSAREEDHSIRRSKNRRPPPPPSPCAKIMLGVGGEREGGKGTPLGIELPLTSRRRLRVYTSGAAGLRAGAERTPRYYRRVCRRRCWLAAGAVIDGYYLLQVGTRGGYLVLVRRCGRHVRPREIETRHHHLPVSRSLRLASTTGTGWAMICFFAVCGWARPCLVWWRGEVKTRRTIFFL